MNAALNPQINRIRTLPIRTKLALLSVMVVVSLASILSLSWFRNESLQQMNETRTAILSMDMMLLDLQRSQNNFVNLFDPRYREEFSSTFETFVERTEDLKQRFWDLNLPIDTLEQLVILTSEYQYLFEVMAEIQTKIGQDQTEGLRKAMADATQAIEAELQTVPNVANTRQMLHRQVIILQVFAQDLLLHKKTEVVGQFESNFELILSDVDRLIVDVEGRTRLKHHLKAYRKSFLDLADAAQAIGLDFGHGLRSDISTTVNASRTAIADMTAEVNVAIDRRETNLDTLIGSLAVLFSLTFLLALIFLGRSISIPIRKITDIMTRLADGQLSVDIPDQARRDEIGDMMRALRVFKMGAIIRRRTQEELRKAHNELERRVEERTRALSEEVQERRRTEDELLRAREQAESANTAKSLFLANMSHELRTPLNAIIGYSEMLQEDAADLGYDQISPDLEKINGAGKHLLGIINEILDLSKIEAGRIDISIEPFVVQDVINSVTDTVQPLMATNNNMLKIEAAPNIGTMETDVTRLRQILFNFLSNAAKFTENGEITLRIIRESDVAGDSMVFMVSDTGIGMDQKQLGMVFEPFTQADASTTRKYGGTGLGLTVNREFARLMGGEVSAKSSPGKGATFTVRLPATHPNAAGHVAHDLLT